MVDFYGSKSELARVLGESRQLVAYYISNEMPPKLEWAWAVEKDSGGQLEARKLRPDMPMAVL